MSLLDNPADTIYVSGSIFDTETVITVSNELLSNVFSVNGQVGNVIIDTGNFITGVDLSSYATITNLALTGNVLQSQIDSLDLNYASDLQLSQTGSNLQSQINNLYNSGFITGVDLAPYVTKSNGQFINRPTLNGTGVLLSGDIKTIDVTYSELTGLKASNNLIPGETYKITDFRLMWWNQSVNNLTIKSGSIEPIIVTAIGTNSIYSEARSAIHKNDIIYYDVDAISSNTWGIWKKNTQIPNFKGWIYRRIDNQNNIDIGWDWRNITVPCRKVNVSSIPQWSSAGYIPQNYVVRYSGKLYYSNQTIIGQYTQIKPNDEISGVLFWEPLTSFYEEYTYFPCIGNNPSFSEPDTDYGYSSELLYNLYLNKIYGQYWSILSYTGQEIQQPTFTSNVTGSGYQYLTGIKNIYINNGFNNIFYHYPSNLGVENDKQFPKISNIKINKAYINLISNNFSSNIFDNCGFNTIGQFCQENNFSTLFNNNIQDQCTQNNGWFYKNTIGYGYKLNNINFLYNNSIGRDSTVNQADSLRSNIIGQSFYSNDIGNDFQWNTIQKLFQFNVIKNSFQFNIIGDECLYNNIGHNCNNNYLGFNFQYNTIKNNFTNNDMNIFFQYNNIENNFSNNFCYQNFQNNTIENNISGLDFELSTYVYEPYSKTIFRDISGNASLMYFNENKQIVVVDASA